jgi:hypothetical protein
VKIAYPYFLGFEYGLGQGAAAARLLLRALDDYPVDASDDDMVFSSALVLRGSTAPPSTV